jgi:hypothetical protein
VNHEVRFFSDEFLRGIACVRGRIVIHKAKQTVLDDVDPSNGLFRERPEQMLAFLSRIGNPARSSFSFRDHRGCPKAHLGGFRSWQAFSPRGAVERFLLQSEEKIKTEKALKLGHSIPRRNGLE